MKVKLLGIAAFFAAVLLLLSISVALLSKSAESGRKNADIIVDLNEVDRLTDNAEIHEKILHIQQQLRDERPINPKNNGIFLAALIMIIGCGFLSAVILYVYFAILRPFDKLRGFADEISKGNFDIPLDYTRSNYFGAFTWAFDNMRVEITKARAAEREATQNNKTIIATLSHDIKTPLASIQTYAEAFEASLDTSPERREKYIKVIIKKCAEVARLTDDLFLHSLSNLNMLKIEPERLELFGFLTAGIPELAADGDLHFSVESGTAFIMADGKRLLQIIENLVNNSRKYAKTAIEISASTKDGNAEITVRDSGSGIPDADMPFIFGKFYRGKNSANEQGSGLGLYIVRYLTEKMNGTITLQNLKNGLEAKIHFPLVP